MRISVNSDDVTGCFLDRLCSGMFLESRGGSELYLRMRGDADLFLTCVDSPPASAWIMTGAVLYVRVEP